MQVSYRRMKPSQVARWHVSVFLGKSRRTTFLSGCSFMRDRPFRPWPSHAATGSSEPWPSRRTTCTSMPPHRAGGIEAAPRMPPGAASAPPGPARTNPPTSQMSQDSHGVRIPLGLEGADGTGFPHRGGTACAEMALEYQRALAFGVRSWVV